MISKKYLPIIITFVFSVFMSTVMSVAMPLVNTGSIPFPAVLFSILLAIIVSFIAGLIVPAGKMGADLAEKMNFKEGSIPFLLISSLVPTIYFTLIMTFTFAVQRTGFTSAVWNAFVGDLGISLVIAYVTTVLVTPLVGFISQRIASK